MLRALIEPGSRPQTPEETSENGHAEKNNGSPPEVDEHGIHEDHPEGVEWTTRSNASRLLTEAGFRISKTSMNDKMAIHCQNAPTKSVIATNNREEVAVRLDDTRKAALQIPGIRIFASEDGIFTSKAGRKWATVTGLKRIYGISRTGRILREKKVKSIDGRTHTGRPTKLFDMEVAEAILKPKAEKLEKGVQIDEEGCYRNVLGLWVTPRSFYDSLDENDQEKTTPRSIRRFAQDECRSLPVVTLDKDGNKKLTKENVHLIFELEKMPALDE